MTGAEPPTLRLRRISRRYANSGAAIQRVDLDIPAGEFLAVIGRSGSGKSTLLNIIGLLDTEWTGEYWIGSTSVASMEDRERDRLRARTFGFVFQSSFANPYESVIRNASLGLSIQGLRLEEQSERAMRALAQVGLDDKAHQLARELSGGERQRLAVARALATEPRVIVADEPTGNLDSEAGRRVMESLLRLNKAGTTVVVVTHDAEVARYASRVAVMTDGVLTEHERRTPPVREDLGMGFAPEDARADRRSPASLWELPARAVNNISSRPLRSISLIAAFALAFTGLIGSAGIASTAAQQIASRISLAARDEVRVNIPAGMAAAERTKWRAAVSALDQVKAVGELVSIDASSARVSRGVSLGNKQETFRGSTVATDAALLEMFQVSTLPGAASELFTSRNPGNVALIGKSVADDLNVSEGSFGAEIWVQGEPYNVVGMITASVREPYLLSSVVIPIQQVPASASELVVRTTVGWSAAVAEAIPSAIDPAAPARISVATASDLRNLRVGVQTDLNGLLAAIAGALLGVAVLSGASAMLLAVQSRLQELALMRALGLSRRRVSLLFLLEGATLGMSGSLVGIAGGVTLSTSIAAANGWTAVAPWQASALAPVIGAVAGAMAAVVPALRAARVDPAEAIR